MKRQSREGVERHGDGAILHGGGRSRVVGITGVNVWRRMRCGRSSGDNPWRERRRMAVTTGAYNNNTHIPDIS